MVRLSISFDWMVPTLEGLRQQTPVVGDQDRQVWRQGATEVHFGLGEASLGVGAKTCPLASGRAVRVAWEEAAVVRVFATATVQVDTPQGLGIDTKTNGAFSETGDVIELEALTGLAVVSTAIAVVVVEIHGARAEGQLAVFHETGSACCLGENPQCHGHGQAGLVHVVLLYVLIFVYLWR